MKNIRECFAKNSVRCCNRRNPGTIPTCAVKCHYKAERGFRKPSGQFSPLRTPSNSVGFGYSRTSVPQQRAKDPAEEQQCPTDITGPKGGAHQQSMGTETPSPHLLYLFQSTG